jgi:hypothetical protein
MKAKFLFIASLVLFYTVPAQSQNYQINLYNGQFVNTCTGDFYDSGGAGAGYGSSEDFSMTFCSNSPVNTHIRLYFQEFNIDPGDTLFIYNGPALTSPLLGKYNNNNTLLLFPVEATADNVSGCLGIRFKSDASPTNAPGWQAAISCIPLCQTVIASLDSINMSPMPQDSGFIDVCQGDTLTFVGKGLYPQNNLIYAQSDATSQFYWYFGDGTYDTGMIVHHFFNSFKSYRVNLTVADIHGCSSMNSIPYYVRMSKNPVIHVATVPDICSGGTVHLNVSYNNPATVKVKLPEYQKNNIVQMNSMKLIADSAAPGGPCLNSHLTLSSFNPGQTLAHLSDIQSVSLNMEHSSPGDLEISLICPNGQQARLKRFNHNGHAYLGTPMGGNNWASWDCISPNACMEDPLLNPAGTGWTYTWSMDTFYSGMNNYTVDGNILGASYPTYPHPQLDTMTYKPDDSFSNLIGCPLNGIWTIRICDSVPASNGWLMWWKLKFDPDIIPWEVSYHIPIDTVVWMGPYIIQQIGGAATIYPATGGTFNYTVNMVDAFGCLYDTSVHLTVVTSPLVDLGPDINVCDGTPVSLTAQFYQGASYIWLPGFMTTQSIPVSQTGTYISVIQTSNANIQCEESDTIQVTFHPTPAVTLALGPVDSICFNYLPVVLSGGNPAGGTYHGNGVNANNIFIPSMSLIGNQKITYVYANAWGCKDSSYAFMHVDYCNGIGGIDNENGFSVFPNPSSGAFEIIINDPHEALSLSITNASGQLVLHKQLLQQGTKIKEQVSLADFPKGIYFLSIKGNTIYRYLKVILQ